MAPGTRLNCVTASRMKGPRPFSSDGVLRIEGKMLHPCLECLAWGLESAGGGGESGTHGMGDTGRTLRALCSPSYVAIATLAHFAPAVSTASTLGLNAMNSDKRAAAYNPAARM